MMHRFRLFSRSALTLLALGFALEAPAQVEFPAASPAATLKQRVGLTDFEITYSRPSVRGREIFGGLVPFGEVWRTGANAPSKLTLSTPARFGGAEVPAGTFALFSIPGKDSWTVIVSRQTEVWGAMGYDSAQDVARIKIAPERLDAPVESFMFGFDDLREESATLFLAWHDTRISIPLEVESTPIVMARIDEVMASDAERKPWHQAAAYYYDHEADPAKALAWSTRAVEANPQAYWSMHLRAKILARLGEEQLAAEAARASLESARAAGNSDYVRLNEDLLASLR
jgi:hypothetical protein